MLFWLNIWFVNSLSGKEEVFDFVSFNYIWHTFMLIINILQDFVDATKTQKKKIFAYWQGLFSTQLIVLNFIATFFFHFLLHEYILNSIKFVSIKSIVNAIYIKYDVWAHRITSKNKNKSIFNSNQMQN